MERNVHRLTLHSPAAGILPYTPFWNVDVAQSWVVFLVPGGNGALFHWKKSAIPTSICFVLTTRQLSAP
ncbi:hypothetical protein EC392_00665 [Lonsdalea populi]|uniref:Uncharacterized protein n=1 Tax=Lonsdalea populi TaxID=1172565 RepID=A0A3N0UQ40_9GAMM|nr:hypothetical protein EC393_00790 [Lonsdalea populi]ROH84695.1 hypothetical protein EC392_00665 [Lonsdalea populi]ROH85032.1 hypothetical protein EC394_00660 [Lonsdalea populi]